LILVCNRANPPKDAGAGTLGGVPVALASALRERGGVWFGWSGKTAPRFTGTARLGNVAGLSIASVDLTGEDVDEYFHGYANNALWQIFHYRPSAYASSSVSGFERFNMRFAKALRPLLRDGDIVWAHDYQLIFLARELRRLGVKNPVGFFLHIPWPPRQLLAMLPQHERLVEALFSYDLLGFHTEEWRQAFADHVRTISGAAVMEDGAMRAHRRTIMTGSFPVGIDADEIAAAASAPEAAGFARSAKENLGARRLMIGVDRLDYPKGLEERLLAFEHWLAVHPENRHALLYHQVTPAMTDATETFRAIRRRVRSRVRRINRRYANGSGPVVHFINRMHRRHELAGLYRSASIGLVTPLCDGMNLVAKEFVAAQDPKDPGVLILSRFAGAAVQLKEALLVNPFSREESADAISAALAMERHERRVRWEALMHNVSTWDVSRWVETFLAALERCSRKDHAGTQGSFRDVGAGQEGTSLHADLFTGGRRH
jgi:trehalose 6-phosphate synthase